MQEIGLKASAVSGMSDLERITTGLAAARANIKTWSNQIAETELLAADHQDKLNYAYAVVFVGAATEVGDNGKLINPNIDSQKAATVVALNDLASYREALKAHRELLKEIQKAKNAIVCEHERRGDLKAEIELLKLLKDER